MLVNEKAPILANDDLGCNLWLMTLRAPDIAHGIEPGQFVHMLVPGMPDHILRRPFSVYAANEEEGTLDILYQVVGFGTDHMTALELGAECEVIGPVGYGWKPPADARRALLVGGGVGSAPLFMLAEQLVEKGTDVDVVLGAQTQGALVTRGRYERLLAQAEGCTSNAPRCATDDGSFGREGFCTSLVEEALAEAADSGARYDYLAVCGPEPLMRIVADLALEAGVTCQVSLEKRMACGIGACLSCVVETVHGKRRACVNGPVFNAKEVVWA